MIGDDERANAREFSTGADTLTGGEFVSEIRGVASGGAKNFVVGAFCCCVRR